MLSSLTAPMIEALELVIKHAKQREITVLDGTSLTSDEGTFLYHFKREDKLEDFVELNDEQRVEAHGGVTATVVNASGTEIQLAFSQALSEAECKQLTLTYKESELEAALRDKLKDLQDNPQQLGEKSFSQQALPVAEGVLQAPYSPNFQPYPAQQQAIQRALGSEVTSIIGPPGTGKTAVLAAIVIEHMLAGRSVLITSHTNIAVDNAMMRIKELCEKSGQNGPLQMG